MKRENILISEDYTTKRVSATKFTAPGNVPAFDCSIHFGEEGNDVTMQNCIIQDNRLVKCSPDDTYDFEVGALIALMKMCGAKKAAEACCEAFPHETSGSIYRENKQYIKRIKELEKENERLKASGCGNGILNGKLLEENARLEEENEKLKLDCEKLQHGYIDTDMIFCGGRQNGKQYTFLKKLFKSIPKDKVETAYKEAYNKRCYQWNKPSTKREEMWNDILACGDCEHSKYVKVKKEDLSAFFKEAEEHKIFTSGGYDNLVNVYKHLYLEGSDSFTFQMFHKPAGFVCCNVCLFTLNNKVIDYLPPMRWDLFKKGRLAVKVTYNNYKEFYEACEKELGKKPCSIFWDDAPITISICKKDGNFEIFTIEDQKKTGKKIVGWEDVR